MVWSEVRARRPVEKAKKSLFPSVCQRVRVFGNGEGVRDELPTRYETLSISGSGELGLVEWEVCFEPRMGARTLVRPT